MSTQGDGQPMPTAEKDVVETRVEWGIAWHFLPSPQPYPDEESARRLVRSYLDNPDALEGDPIPVAVSRVVTTGPWTRVFRPDDQAVTAEKDAFGLSPASHSPVCIAVEQSTDALCHLEPGHDGPHNGWAHYPGQMVTWPNRVTPSGEGRDAAKGDE